MAMIYDFVLQIKIVLIAWSLTLLLTQLLLGIDGSPPLGMSAKYMIAQGLDDLPILLE